MICYETVANVREYKLHLFCFVLFCFAFFIVKSSFFPSPIWHSSCLTDIGAHKPRLLAVTMLESSIRKENFFIAFANVQCTPTFTHTVHVYCALLCGYQWILPILQDYLVRTRRNIRLIYCQGSNRTNLGDYSICTYALNLYVLNFSEET